MRKILSALLIIIAAVPLSGCLTAEQISQKEASFRATMAAVRAGVKVAKEELSITIAEICSIVPAVEMKAAEVRAAIVVTPGTRAAAAVAAAETSVTLFIEACNSANIVLAVGDVTAAVAAARRIGDSYNRSKTAINNANAAVKAAGG